MGEPQPDVETLVVFIEHLLSVIDDKIPEGPDGCQICENARHAAHKYRNGQYDGGEP